MLAGVPLDPLKLCWSLFHEGFDPFFMVFRLATHILAITFEIQLSEKIVLKTFINSLFLKFDGN
jgi:hypothetical protein